MTAISASERELARRLIALAESECRAAGSAAGPDAAAERVFQRLRAHLTMSIGAEGFRALLTRAIDRSRSDHPLLASLSRRAESDSPVHALAESIRAANPAEATEALIVLVATFIALLGRFVGAGLAMQLVEQSWPAASHGDQHNDPTRSRTGDAPHG